MKPSLSERLIKRKIKEAIRDLLLDKTQAGKKVYISRSIPVDEEDLPAIVIHTLNENIKQFSASPKDYQRELTVAIECLANGNTDDELDLELEAMGEQVETLMEIDPTLGDIVNKIELAGCAYQQDPSGQNPLGSLVLQFTIEFYTDAIRPGSLCLPDYKETAIDWRVAHIGDEPKEDADATDSIIFEGEEP